MTCLFPAALWRGLSRIAAPALLLAALPAVAEAKPMTLNYLAYMLGYPVLSMTAQVDLPQGTSGAGTSGAGTSGAGTSGAGSAVGDGLYALQADMVTQGSLGSLYPYRMSVASHGRLAGGRVSPGQFHSEGTIMQRVESVTLTYGAGGKVAIQAVPPTRQAQEAAATGAANGTIDPASLVMGVVAAYARTQNCSGSFKLFDGVRRYNLDVRQVGSGNVQFYKQSYYQGPAVECQAVPQLIQGFQPMAVQSKLYPESANIWLANAVQGMPAVPVRIETQNALGQMVFDLVSVQ